MLRVLLPRGISTRCMNGLRLRARAPAERADPRGQTTVGLGAKERTEGCRPDVARACPSGAVLAAELALPAEPQLADERAVPVLALALEVVEQPAPLADQLQEAAPPVVILLVLR